MTRASISVERELQLPTVKHFLLIYDVTPDYPTRRAEFRAEHLKLAWDASARGELVMGGALTDPIDTAILLFRCETKAPVEAFVQADPYVRNGLVASHRIREWTTVVGESAIAPLRIAP
jgi:uncharacterized protein YciI